MHDLVRSARPLASADVARPPIGSHVAMDPVGAAAAMNDLIKPQAVIAMPYGANPLALSTAARFAGGTGTQTAVRVPITTPGQSLRF